MKDKTNQNENVKFIDPNPDGGILDKMYKDLKKGGEPILSNSEHKFNLKNNK